MCNWNQRLLKIIEKSRSQILFEALQDKRPPWKDVWWYKYECE